jgi:hypothetical protein
MRSNLKDKMEKMVQLGFDERQYRIDKWQKELDADKKRRDEMVENRVKDAEREPGTLGGFPPDQAATSQEATTLSAPAQSETGP